MFYFIIKTRKAKIIILEGPLRFLGGVARLKTFVAWGFSDIITGNIFLVLASNH